jgi:hypothetical protein
MKKLCGEKYSGPSYPDFHGATCHQAKGHDAGPPHGIAKHMAWAGGGPLSWYSEEQKKARAAEKEASK